MDLSERVAHYLLEIRSRLPIGRCTTPQEFDLPVSREVMSEVPGLSVPHLNRTLARLRGDGMIASAGRHVTLADTEALQLLAHYQPPPVSPGSPSPRRRRLLCCGRSSGELRSSAKPVSKHRRRAIHSSVPAHRPYALDDSNQRSEIAIGYHGKHLPVPLHCRQCRHSGE